MRLFRSEGMLSDMVDEPWMSKKYPHTHPEERQRDRSNQLLLAPFLSVRLRIVGGDLE